MLTEPVKTTQHLEEERLARARIGEVVLRRFRIDDFLSGGAMGIVFQGTDLDTGRSVAVKLVHTPAGRTEEQARQRYEREVQFLARLSSPHIVQLVQHGITDKGENVVVMELLEGCTLRQRLVQQIVLPTGYVVSIGHQIARAAHSLHIVGAAHRDLSPTNIFLQKTAEGDWVKLLDFGLVKPFGFVHSSSPRITMAGHLLGTPTYMSPEQMASKLIDERADVYSLGVILFEMLAGRPPFTGTITEILTQHYSSTVPRLDSDLHCPPKLEDLVRRCVEKEPKHRPRTMLEVLQMLEDPRILQPPNHPGYPDWTDAPTELGDSISDPESDASNHTQRIDVLSAISQDALTATIDTDIEHVGLPSLRAKPSHHVRHSADDAGLEDEEGSNSPWEGNEAVTAVDEGLIERNKPKD